MRGVGGLLPSLYDYKTKVEYGSSKSITRKGALGIRLWFCYKSYSKGSEQDSDKSTSDKDDDNESVNSEENFEGSSEESPEQNSDSKEE